MIIKRQGILLSLLEGMKREVSSVNFQKILFLYSRKEEEDGMPLSYDFLPAEMGCYSYTARYDKKKLVEEGALDEIDGTWKIASDWKGWDAKKKLDYPTRVRIDRICKAYRDWSTEDLLNKVYKEYPWFAIRSKCLQQVLGNDEVALGQVKKESLPPEKTTRLFTIGYEGLSLEVYFTRLLKAGVSLLCDVRRTPFSHKFGFSKKTLSFMCERTGIKYVHLPELGIPSERRTRLETQADYDALFEVYEREDLPKQEKALDKISDWVLNGELVALTCAEFLPCQCHRSVVASALSQKTGLPYSHLFVPQNV